MQVEEKPGSKLATINNGRYRVTHARTHTVHMFFLFVLLFKNSHNQAIFPPSSSSSTSCFSSTPLLREPSIQADIQVCDFGSGLAELQAVRRHSCMTGQSEGVIEHTSAADQWPSSSPSSQWRSGAPVRPALASASSTATRLTGRRSTGFKPWKLCSM